MLFDPKVFPYLLQETYVEFGGRDYLFFEEPIEFYSLNFYKRKIVSFPQLMYVMEVLLWLNPTIEYDTFLQCALWLSDWSNGKVTETYPRERVERGIERMWQVRPRKPYVNKYRRIIFNPSKMHPKEYKWSMIGKLCSKSKVTPDTLYDVIENMMHENVYISINVLAKSLSVTRQTISRHITASMKEIIKYHNQNLK